MQRKTQTKKNRSRKQTKIMLTDRCKENEEGAFEIREQVKKSALIAEDKKKRGN